ncbi:hypothetical protein L9F63_000135, partial [Diploptera punctata]
SKFKRNGVYSKFFLTLQDCSSREILTVDPGPCGGPLYNNGRTRTAGGFEPARRGVEGFNFHQNESPEYNANGSPPCLGVRCQAGNLALEKSITATCFKDKCRYWFKRYLNLHNNKLEI